MRTRECQNDAEHVDSLADNRNRHAHAVSIQNMMRVLASVLLILLCGLGAYAMADDPIAGKWDCVSTDERGTDVAWTLVVKSEAGKLSGTILIANSGEEIQILEPALSGDTFSFKIRIGADEIVELTARIDGKKLEGKFKGNSSGTGTFKGVRL